MLLALDLGTKTGYALQAAQYPMAVGTWILATDRELKDCRKKRMDRRCDPRVRKLYSNLRSLHESLRLDWIVFEDVQFASSTLQVQLWSSLRAAVWLMSEFGVQIECCAVGTLKKFATSHGNADKDQMMRALALKNKRFVLEGKYVRDSVTNERLDDNAIDALHLLEWSKSIGLDKI